MSRPAVTGLSAAEFHAIRAEFLPALSRSRSPSVASRSFDPPSTASGSSESSAEGSFVSFMVLYAKPEKADALACFLKDLSNQILENQEELVVSHRSLKCMDDGECGKFILYAHFSDYESFDLHLQSGEFQTLVEQGDLLATQPEIFFYRDV